MRKLTPSEIETLIDPPPVSGTDRGGKTTDAASTAVSVAVPSPWHREKRDLIDRLEKATGPSTELNAMIAARLGIMDDFDPTMFIVPVEYRVSDDGRHVEGWTTVDGKSWRQASRKPRSFTGSFDDAKTMIPPGLYWHAGEGKTRADEPLGAASIIAPGSLETISEAEHASVIIAMCIAALKARASDQHEARP